MSVARVNSGVILYSPKYSLGRHNFSEPIGFIDSLCKPSTLVCIGVISFLLSFILITNRLGIFDSESRTSDMSTISYGDIAARYTINDTVNPRINKSIVNQSKKVSGSIAKVNPKVVQIKPVVMVEPDSENISRTFVPWGETENLRKPETLTRSLREEPFVEKDERSPISIPKPIAPEAIISQPSTSEIVQQVFKIVRRYRKNHQEGVKLAARIVGEAERQGYDPLFVAAVIKSESGFNTLATSNVGAKGLMQIMPDTGRFLEQIKDVGPRPQGFLTDPGYNLKLGIQYLMHLEELYHGNKMLTLIAYNWGPGHVDRTMQGKIKGVPKEVVNYALKILSDHNGWRKEIFSQSNLTETVMAG